MSCSYYANLIVGISIQCDKKQGTVTRYDNITGKPYEVKVSENCFKTLDGIELDQDYANISDDFELDEKEVDWPKIGDKAIKIYGEGNPCCLGVQLEFASDRKMNLIDFDLVAEAVRLMDDWLRTEVKTGDRARIIIWSEVVC